MTARFLIEALGPGHDRAGFASGVDALDRYFRGQVTQDVRRRTTSCYVALDRDKAKVAGYYTLAAAGIPLTEMPEELAKKLPRYPSVPVARVGRLAVDWSYRGQPLGGTLLWDAGRRALRTELALFALMVDAKDEQAANFFRHHGFVAFGSRPRQFVLPLIKLAEAGGHPMSLQQHPRCLWESCLRLERNEFDSIFKLARIHDFCDEM